MPRLGVTIPRDTMARDTIVTELMLLRLTMANLQILTLMQAQAGPAAMRRAPGVAIIVISITPMSASLTMRPGTGRPPSRDGRHHDGRWHWPAGHRFGQA